MVVLAKQDSEQSTAQSSSAEVVNLDGRRVQLGALDLGSNSFHLIVAQEANGRIQVLDKHKEMVRLAAGLDENNHLSKQARQRALDCLRRFAQRLRPLAQENVRIVGTNTLRKADSKGFLAEAEEILGHKIDIISGREEARLIYVGVCHDLGISSERRLVVDIGGGSTELIAGTRGEAEVLESLYMGCVSMTRSRFSDGKISKDAFKKAEQDAMLELEPVAQSFLDKPCVASIGTSGTINAIFRVVTQHFGHDNITLDALAELKQYMIKAGHVDDLQLTGLDEERKAVFPGGVAILISTFAALKVDEMSACGSALREGLIVDLVGRQHHEDARDETVAQLMARYHVDEIQARHVRESALALLSQVAMSWELTSAHSKQLIGWAADLAEIGMDIAHPGYHKHSAYLLENMDMPGFSRTDQYEVATLVRTHRRKIPADLFTEHEQPLKRLTALLRISAVLHRNRSHESPPHFGAKAKADTLEISLDEAWLQSHPLTELDLANEAGYLEGLGIKLVIKTH